MTTFQEVKNLLKEYTDNTVTKISSIYDENVMNQTRFAYVSIFPSKNTLIIKKTSPWIGCRGYMCEALFSTIKGIPFRLNSTNYLLKSSICIDASCLLLRNIEEVYLSQGIRMLNLLEAKVGWDKSFYKTIKNSECKIPKATYLFVADKRWFSSTAHLSLLLMLIRMSAKVMFEPNDVMETWVKKVVVSHTHLDVRRLDTDTLQVLFKNHSNVIQIFLEHQEFLTEELKYNKLQLPQDSGQDAGIYIAAKYANKFIADNKKFETRKEIKETLSNLSRSSSYLRLNAPLMLRFSIALREYGNNRKILKC